MKVLPNSVKEFLTQKICRPYLLQRKVLLNMFTIVEHKRCVNKIKKNLSIGEIVDTNDILYTHAYSEITLEATNDNIEYYYNKKTFEYRVPRTENIEYKSGKYLVISWENNLYSPNTYFINKVDNSESTTTLHLVTSKEVPTFTGYTFLQDEKYIYGAIYKDNFNTIEKYVVLANAGEAIFAPRDQINISQGDIDNHTSAGVIPTTVGRYVTNYIVLVDPFQDLIPYINEVVKDIPEIYEKRIVELIQTGRATALQGRKYLDNIFYLGSFGELCVPVFSPKSITTDPKIAKRKQELLDQYKDQLHDSVILAKIEDELISMDKEWLKGDVSEGFFGDTGKKHNVHRKKQYLTGGITEGFGTGDYSFIKNSLSEGWDIEEFSTIVNDLRKGSYGRGVETQLGGVVTKNLLRLFQNLKITSDNCGTNRYLQVHIKNIDMANSFIYRYLLQNKMEVLITKELAPSLIGTTIKVRSPMYCQEPGGGYCYKCAGDLFKNMDLENIGVLVLEIGKTFTLQAMKSMHGTKVSSLKITDLNRYVL